MKSERLSYVVITPARNEVEHLPRLGQSLAEQTVRPRLWLVVDNGSTDETVALVRELAARHDWIRVQSVPEQTALARGGPIVRAFHTGLAALDGPPDVVVKVDADVSMDSDYFERLLSAFAADPSLGMASGSAHLPRNGGWYQQHTTRTSVWGASRAYRWGCLQDVLPLEERMGWDGIDEFKANVRGWKTGTILDLPFRHHRREGERDGSRRRAWEAQGNVAYYMGYRLPYFALRALYRARREPAAVAMLWGYVKAAARREPRCADPEIRSYLRDQQRLRELPLRVREALGKRAG
jgi:biofilm PGA synthesis N-glycosyltransferase PgaC